LDVPILFDIADKGASMIVTSAVTGRITQSFYSCMTAKFFAKTVPERRLTSDQWPIDIRSAQCTFKNTTAQSPFDIRS
jgi:hypothetical protein